MTTSAKSLFKLRKTPVQTGSEQTIEVTLAATTQILKEDVSASTDRIADRAGFSIETRYQYC